MATYLKYTASCCKATSIAIQLVISNSVDVKDVFLVRKCFGALMNFRLDHKEGQVFQNVYKMTNATLYPQNDQDFHKLQGLLHPSISNITDQLYFSNLKTYFMSVVWEIHIATF